MVGSPLSMEVFKEFLQVSSIHGFGHIAATRRFSRIFWILVVIFGFSVSSYLIYQSFSNWSESPVSTTIETLPISKLKFPKVMVCPPKNTRTNLNYDLILSENLTLDEGGKQDFEEFIKLTILEIISDSVSEDVKSYVERDKYRNWYDGFTQLLLPELIYAAETNTKVIKVSTNANSGTFVTPYFREKFDSNKFSLLVEFKLDILIPNSVFKSKTVELILEIDYDVIERHDSQSFEIVEIIAANIEKLESSNEKIIKKIPLNRRNVNVEFRRSLTQLDLNNWNSPRMTGMNVSWYYTSTTVQPDGKFVERNGNYFYRKIVSLVHQQPQSEEKLWRAAKLAKMNMNTQDLNFCYDNLFSSSFDGSSSLLLKETLKHLGVKNFQVKKSSEDISDETMELATKIYIYLGNCPKQYWYYWNIWINLYTDILRNHNIRTFLLTLSRILRSSKEKGRKEFEMATRLFRKLSDIFHLPGGEFSPSALGRPCHENDLQ